MSAFLKALFQKYAKRLIMKGQEGILQIPNKDRVNLMANNIYKDFKKFGVTDDMIKSENDIKVLHSQIANIEGQTISRNLREALKPKKSADVLDLTGKKIDTSKPILGGKNVPESEGMFDNIFNKMYSEHKGGPKIVPKSEAQIKSKLEGMNKKTVDRIRRRRYEAARKAEREKMAKDPDYLPKIIDPEDFAYGGIAGMLGEPTYADGGRVPLGTGKFVFDAARRKFLELMGGAAATGVAAKTGLFGLLKGGGKKQIIKDLTSVPIKDIPGMPPWFKLAVNKTIKEGDDVTKKFATKEREIVHTNKIGKDKFADEVTVTQDLDTGNVRVEYDTVHSMGEAPIQLDYKAGEIIEEGSKKGTKTKAEFSL